jgi:hypothetical protein
MENSQENIKETKTLHDLKEEFIEDLDIATAIENDEVNNEEMAKGDALENLEYADGKERDEVDLVEEQEKIFGTNKISPFKTADVRVFRRRLDVMSRDQMVVMAQRVGARQYATEEDQKSELMKAFHSWVSTNGFVQTDSTKQSEKGALSEAFEQSENKNDLEEKLKSKTLSELQETASRLGFNPSFERDRLINIIIQEYQRQS